LNANDVKKLDKRTLIEVVFMDASVRYFITVSTEHMYAVEYMYGSDVWQEDNEILPIEYVLADDIVDIVSHGAWKGDVPY
jgi:hypothetical protein